MELLLKLKEKFAKDKFSLGLDIGTKAIKTLKLRHNHDILELCGFAIEPAQTDLREPLKKMRQSQGQEAVNIGVSGAATVLRDVNFLRMNSTELKQALKFEAQKHIPFSISEVNLDGFIIKEDLPDNKMLVLLAAVKKDFLNQRLGVLEDAGFKTHIVDIDSLALINAFNFNYAQENNLKNKTIALLNIGASISNLSILENGSPHLSRDIHVAGNNLTQRIADLFGVDFNSAENLKINPDKEKMDKVTAALDSVLANLAGEIRTSFDYYESRSTASVIKIFLSGGGSMFKGLNDMLANLLGTEVGYWDPLRKINLASDIDSDRIKALSSQLAVAVGLALRT
jgi:type IV pilus assembly protein PilM